MKSVALIVIGSVLNYIGFINPGMWPWILFCMVGGGLIGRRFAELYCSSLSK